MKMLFIVVPSLFLIHSLIVVLKTLESEILIISVALLVQTETSLPLVEEIINEDRSSKSLSASDSNSFCSLISSCSNLKIYLH